MKKFMFFMLSSFAILLSCSGYQYQQEISVAAGSFDRPQTPMYKDILLPAVSTGVPVCLHDGKQKIAGQIENMGSGIARIWWLQPAMQAGQIQNWTIFVGRSCSKAHYTWIDTTGHTALLTFDDTPVLEYKYLAFDPDQAIMTQRPYHHIFAPDGSERISKGPCGLHSHQRGLFFGYRDVSIADSLVNFWSTVNGSHTAHQALVSQSAGPVFGGHTVSIEWRPGNMEPVAAEFRTVRAFKLDDGSTLIDFTTQLESMSEFLELRGNRHHGGVQFRAAQDVAEHPETTQFIRPANWAQYATTAELPDDADHNLPWDAMQFSMDGHDYTVGYFSAPSNPEPSDMGERQYGRIGEYIPWTLNPQTPLELHYRLWVLEGNKHNQGVLQNMYNTMGEPAIITTLD